MGDIKVAVITIGEEILLGHTLDTNAHFISNVLSEIGTRIVLRSSVGDRTEDIYEVLAYAEKKSDIIMITGGLGPTNDDITKRCLAAYFNSELIINQEALDQVTSYFRRRGFALTEINRRQAEIPAIADAVINDMGTAPGMWIEKDGKVFVSMPGVPHEMQHMVREKVIPRLKEKYETPVILHKLIMTAGIGESWLAEKIAGWESGLPENLSLAYLPGYGQVKLRITGVGNNYEELEEQLSLHTGTLKQVIGSYIYGEGGEALEQRIGSLLGAGHMTLATAESCTGGHIAHLITSIPGSSDYYIGGVIAYHNQIKTGFLGVKQETLREYGAVSESTVKEMAEGIRRRFKTNFGLATSGIAGPGGGMPDKPVGTVWVAVADGEGQVAKKYNIPKDRLNNIKYSSVAALVLLWQRLSQNTGTDQ